MNLRRSWSLLSTALLLLAGVTLAGRAGVEGERWDDDETVTLTGTLVDVARPLATLEADGQRYVVHLGPQWYWDREGYRVAEGDAVTILGQVQLEGDAKHLYLHTLTRGEDLYRFADDDGAPLWSRQGQRRADDGGAAPGQRAGCGGCQGCGGCGKGRRHRGGRS